MPRFATYEIYERHEVKTALLETYRQKWPHPSLRPPEVARYMCELEHKISGCLNPKRVKNVAS